MIEKFLWSESRRRPLLAILVDPFSTDKRAASKIARESEEGGADLILVGGSIGAGVLLDEVISSIKEASSLPVILFPGNVDGISPKADAILFMSLLNSSNPYWIIQAQALAAPVIRRMNLEPIPTAYLIFEPGERSAAGWVGWANPIPRDKSEIALAYSMAAEMLGIRWVYLEAGSGASKPIPVEVVKAISEETSLGVIVGGGIRSGREARRRGEAGARVIVVGTYIERGGRTGDRVREMSSSLKEISFEG